MLYSNILLPLFVEDQFKWMLDVANIWCITLFQQHFSISI